MLENFELHGPAKGLQDTIIKKIARKYEKAALVGLISFWVLAFKCYQKDKKRFW